VKTKIKKGGEKNWNEICKVDHMFKVNAFYIGISK
jgi:hypothetical protein